MRRGRPRLKNPKKQIGVLVDSNIYELYYSENQSENVRVAFRKYMNDQAAHFFSSEKATSFLVNMYGDKKPQSPQLIADELNAFSEDFFKDFDNDDIRQLADIQALNKAI